MLVHCLAGAHRAGTAGVLGLMHLARLRRGQALEAGGCLYEVIYTKFP